jgi:protein-arginine kinase
MRVVNEIIADRLIECQEKIGDVLSDLFLDLSGPLGEVFAVLYQSVIGLKTELNFIENVFSVVVSRVTIDSHGY